MCCEKSGGGWYKSVGGGDRMQLDSDADGIAILLIIIIVTVSEFIKVIKLRCKVVGI